MPESDDLQKHRVYTEAQKNHGEVESEVAVWNNKRERDTKGRVFC